MTDISSIEAALEGVAKGRFSAVKFTQGRITLVLNVGGLDVRDRGQIEIAVKSKLLELDGVETVDIAMTAEKVERRLIAVASGKGGVGKSTLSANLAIAMQRMGRKVGMVDADIYGPSQPRLLHCEGQRPEAEGKQLIPVPNDYDVPVLSMGHLAKPGQAIAWRGPMAGKALEQLIDAHWGDVEELIVDMPPGTGDVQLTLAQKVPVTGAVIVTTPQDIALMDARKGLKMFEKVDVKILGIVENMSTHICSQCGHEEHIFGAGGGEKMCADHNTEFLGSLPLDIHIREQADSGKPTVVADPDGKLSKVYKQIARRVAVKIADMAQDHSAAFPKIVVQNT